MKKIFTIFVCMLAFSLCFAKAEKASPEITGELKVIYSKFTKASTVEAKSKYCIDPDIEKMRESWDGKPYFPTNIIDCLHFPEGKFYCLVESFEMSNGITSNTLYKFAYFKKIKDEFKLDWDAWIVYNYVPLKDFYRLRPEKEYEFRCIAQKASCLSEAMEKDYFPFYIKDEYANIYFDVVYGKKNGAGEKLMSLFTGTDRKEARACIVKMKYDSNIHEFILTEVVHNKWTKIDK